MKTIYNYIFRMLAGCLAFCVVASWSLAEEVGRPNIVLIMADDLGYEGISANGSLDYKTPNIDKLASTGVRFTNAYSLPLCTPTRVKIMTGKYGSRNYTKFGMLDTKEVTFANVLKDAGYATVIAGKWQLGKDRSLINGFGFDEYCLWHLENKSDRYQNVGELIANGEVLPGGKGEYGPDVVSQFLMDFMTKHKDKSFFCYYPMILPHDPFVPTPDSKDQNSKDEKQNFVDMVAYMDKIVGKIVAHLEKLGVRENTLIIFTCDNGTHKNIVTNTVDGPVKGRKGRTMKGGIHVPLVVNWPAKGAKGLVNEDLIDFADFFPTLMQAANVKIPADLHLDGISFLPQIEGKPGNLREWVFGYYTGRHGKKAKVYAQDKKYKLYQSGKFYNIKKDPSEKNPIKDISSLPEKAQANYELLKSAIEQVMGEKS